MCANRVKSHTRSLHAAGALLPSAALRTFESLPVPSLSVVGDTVQRLNYQKLIPKVMLFRNYIVIQLKTL